MVPTRRHARRWSVCAAIGIAVVTALIGFGAWSWLKPGEPNIAGYERPSAPHQSHEAGGIKCYPWNLYRLQPPERAEQAETCKDAQDADKASTETLDYNARAANAAEQAVLTSYYQAKVMFWQTFATVGAFVAAGAAAFFAWIAIGESRRIGEAQTRAYLNVASVSAWFVPSVMPEDDPSEVHPHIDIVVQNAGSSPALEFIYDITVQYVAIAPNNPVRKGHLDEMWKKRIGISIAANGGQYDGGFSVSDMGLYEFLDTAGGQKHQFMLFVEIYFEFRDVFGIKVCDRAYFNGVHMRVDGGGTEDTPYGSSEWRGILHRVPLPPRDFVSYNP